MFKFITPYTLVGIRTHNPIADTREGREKTIENVKLFNIFSTGFNGYITSNFETGRWHTP
jgi:hypothetical protein